MNGKRIIVKREIIKLTTKRSQCSLIQTIFSRRKALFPDLTVINNKGMDNGKLKIGKIILAPLNPTEILEENVNNAEVPQQKSMVLRPRGKIFMEGLGKKKNMRNKLIMPNEIPIIALNRSLATIISVGEAI
tara:strand:+ start:297 stop:692 length:396 start_codon:yes stop_codon:yes gene_type:complete